jgi:hypothetical protein
MKRAIVIVGAVIIIVASRPASPSEAPVTLEAGDLKLGLEATADGIGIASLRDSAAKCSLVPAKPLPLFAITLRPAGKTDQVTLTADQGWREVEITGGRPAATPLAGDKLVLRWRKPADPKFGGISVVVRVSAEPATASLLWTLAVDQVPSSWTLWHVVFPQLGIVDLGPSGAVFFPKAAGEVQRGVWQRPFRYSGTYPSGWCSIPIIAAYDENRRTGLCLAMHDPWASTKDLLVESSPKEGLLTLAVDHPVPEMGQPGNKYEQSGQARWGLLRGDWFDASVAYRKWVRKEAKWYPQLTREGRADTPQWMRELSVWALSGGTPGECVPQVKAFTAFLAPPAAVHWYNWHQIPFDNDYPHYFPTKPGFAAGVRELQASGTFVMPYINGRLWDTHDRGTDDFEFTQVALPAVSKDEKGHPYTETYGSKEKDGSPVRLGVMCPTTALWQSRVRQTVLRLFTECGVKGVYIDQIAAAAPTLCFDRSHGHPAGGGHWWTEGYWKLLSEIRKAMPKGSMLTTECNGEPYIHMLDGYLTWHWQYDGQVPAFSAVYGGAIQMFGRAYGGGETKNLALRMRAGQQLVFGEQIGWIAPGTVLEKENGPFFRDVVLLRRKLARYFSAGEMARPPRLIGSVPTVRADWQWHGVDWVTTSAVLTGAWHQPASGRLVLVFVNVSDQPVTAGVDFDLRPYGMAGKNFSMTRISPAGSEETVSEPAQAFRQVTFPPRSAWAWELTATTAAVSPETTDVFVERTGGYFAYRIPAIECAADGSLLAFAEARKYNLDDPGCAKQDIDLVYRRSIDGGKTWSPLKVIEDPGELWSAANPATVVDRSSGRIWLLYLRCKPGKNTDTARPGTDDSQILARTSDDNGRSWSKPIDLTRVSRGFGDPKWRCSVVGPGGMIQDRRGRLLAACWRFEPFGNFALISEDHGKTWQRSAFVPGHGGDECQLVELADGRLLMDIRQETGPQRSFSASQDGGKTWSPHRPGLPVSPVGCVIERYTLKSAGDDRDRIIWTGPKGPDRQNLVVRVSYDEGQSFPVERFIYAGHAAYSGLTILKDKSVGVLWERGAGHGYQFITFTRLTREFLEP